MTFQTLPESFCPVPWLNASIDVNGSFRPCCKFAQPGEAGALVLGNLKESSLKELWNSRKMQDLRSQFLAGEKPTSCRSCWSEEKSGIPSLRQTFIAHRISRAHEVDFTSTVVPSPRAMDLKLSQKCNFKCMICSPFASSTFLEEDVRAGRFRVSPEDKQFFSAPKILKNSENEAWFRDAISNIEHIELFGGEPMLGEENRKIEDLLIKSGHARNISLLYNTNGSIFLSDVVKNWEHFKRVTVCLSIDDVGERFEYERFPGKWSVIERNLDKYKQQRTSNTDLILFCSISTFNILYLDQWLDWAQQKHPEIYRVLNLVHSPEPFNISLLSPSMKTLAKKRLESWLKRNPADVQMQTELTAIIQFMESGEFNTKAAQEFSEHVALRDSLRKTNFKNIFPDIDSFSDAQP